MGSLLSVVLIWDFVRRVGFGEVYRVFSTIFLQQIFSEKISRWGAVWGISTTLADFRV
jgi:hypothetical protein